jgi:aspartyl-tRNA(Asn)/glutamyl-tRNA(Gln) amidotransferase subunit B
MADFAEKTFNGAAPEDIPRLANLIAGPLSARLNEENRTITEINISPEQLRILGQRVSVGVISTSTATSTIFPILWKGERSVDQIIEENNLKQISDSGVIEKIVDAVMANNAQQVADYKAGKEKAFNSLVGQVMKASQGKANPAQVNEILRKKLG